MIMYLKQNIGYAYAGILEPLFDSFNRNKFSIRFFFWFNLNRVDFFEVIKIREPFAIVHLQFFMKIVQKRTIVF